MNAGHSLNYRSSDFIDKKGAELPPPPPFTATGGTIITPGNGYKYHKFTTATPAPDSSLVVTEGNTDCEILVVAGGGGGGSYYGGGGGGGGIAYAAALNIEPGTYPVSVGPGAPANPGSPTAYFGNDGVNSYFGSPGTAIGGQPDYILAKGGGGGGKGTSDGGRDGGSGGGSGGGDPGPVADGAATQPGTNPSPFVTDYGFPGGFSTPTGGYAPAGGGGAGAAGANVPGNDNGGGNGGAGQRFPVFPYLLINEPGLNPHSPTIDHYAGGGGAGIYGSATGPDRNGLGGVGGGGGGAGAPAGVGPGVDKLGGGGGGRHPANGTNYVGGDGIVLVRYLA